MTLNLKNVYKIKNQQLQLQNQFLLKIHLLFIFLLCYTETVYQLFYSCLHVGKRVQLFLVKKRSEKMFFLMN